MFLTKCMQLHTQRQLQVHRSQKEQLGPDPAEILCRETTHTCGIAGMPGKEGTLQEALSKNTSRARRWAERLELHLCWVKRN